MVKMYSIITKRNRRKSIPDNKRYVRSDREVETHYL